VLVAVSWPAAIVLPDSKAWQRSFWAESIEFLATSPSSSFLPPSLIKFTRSSMSKLLSYSAVRPFWPFFLFRFFLPCTGYDYGSPESYAASSVLLILLEFSVEGANLEIFAFDLPLL